MQCYFIRTSGQWNREVTESTKYSGPPCYKVQKGWTCETFKDLHWLPVQQRIVYKIALLTYKALHGLAPTYISELIEEYKPRRTLRSAWQVLLCTRPPKLCKTKYYGERSFATAAPKVWNKLPSKLRAVSNINSFKKGLKTHLFNASF